jgi:hypothetical protein
MEEPPLKPIKAILQSIRERADYALKELDRMECRRAFTTVDSPDGASPGLGGSEDGTKIWRSRENKGLPANRSRKPSSLKLLPP